MKRTLCFALSVVALVAIPIRSVHAKTIVVAVIDSGVDAAVPNLCHRSHISFAKKLPNPLVDENGHGTHIAGLISTNAGTGDYCIVSVKYYDPAMTGLQNLQNIINAVRYAVSIKVDFINISGGGPEFSEDEFAAIEEALDAKITLVTAAGNEHSDLDKTCDFFPACYDPRLVVVGNLQKAPEGRAPSSNYGNKVTRWEVGTDLLSTLPGGKTGRMTGTSQSAAVATGKLVKEALGK